MKDADGLRPANDPMDGRRRRMLDKDNVEKAESRLRARGVSVEKEEYASVNSRLGSEEACSDLVQQDMSDSVARSC